MDGWPYLRKWVTRLGRVACVADGCILTFKKIIDMSGCSASCATRPVATSFPGFKLLNCVSARLGRLGRSRRSSDFHIIAPIVRIVPIAGKFFETIGVIIWQPGFNKQTEVSRYKLQQMYGSRSAVSNYWVQSACQIITLLQQMYEIFISPRTLRIICLWLNLHVKPMIPRRLLFN